MDFGLKGRTAIVCAASRGLGRGCAEALAGEGVNLVIAARTRADIEATAADIAARYKVPVTAIACDVTTGEGREALLAACPNPDILITNAAGPPPGDFRNFTLDDWRKAAESNFFAPIALIQATVYGMVDRRFGRIVNITSAAVKAPLAALELSNGVRAGLTGAVAVLARNTIKHNVTINNLLPGLHETDRLHSNIAAAMKRTGKDLAGATADFVARVPAGRFGTIEEFGAACAFLCSRQAGFITGQNLVADGGAYPGTL
ncbi:MAG TPA: SDR family oxidoreductase [Beijerinckiaceae bacterium]|nr:SDR family oxidoreductase [Beijerinckiaceae bacterium]